MVNVIWQTWWHIEEVYFPTQARKIRHVMDIFTDETEIPLELNDEFVGLKIFGRNGSSYREIAFLETNGVNDMEPIILNLYPLNSFPCVPKNLCKKYPNLYHVKLEIEYILINPKIFNNWDESLIGKIRGIFFQKKGSTIQINGLIQPEFYITTPPGWRIAEKGHSIGMWCYIRNNPHIKSDKGIVLRNPDPIKINFEEPFIKRTNEKETYNYLIHEASYKTIKELKNNHVEFDFSFTYMSRMSYTLAVISLIPFIIFLPASATILICGLYSLIQKSPFIFDTNLGLGYLIVLLSYSYFYYNLLKDDFHIPNKNLFGLVFALTLFVIFSILLKDIFNIPAFIDSILSILFQKV